MITNKNNQPVKKNNQTSSFVREIMIDELGAINHYIDTLKLIQTKEFYKIIREILMDEVKHYNWMLDVLRQIDPEQSQIYESIKDINIPNFSEDQNLVTNNKPDGDHLDNVLRNDLIGELEAINEYEEILLKIENKNIRKVISNIITDEKDHVEILNKSVDMKKK